MDSVELWLLLDPAYATACEDEYHRNGWALWSDGFRFMYCMGGEL